MFLRAEPARFPMTFLRGGTDRENATTSVHIYFAATVQKAVRLVLIGAGVIAEITR